jgi:rod shape-determining protein MreC
VYDKTVRRRRAVLILLVVLSLILLTAYFGEAPSGRLHSVQRSFLTVISPVQDGANKVLKPVRDLFGWFGDTVHAKSRLAQTLKQNARLTKELVENQSNNRAYRQLLKLDNLDNELSIADYKPVNATVFGESPIIWYSTINIDKGESSGVHMGDPVINAQGLVGKVTQVASDGAQVSLITDSEVGVTVKIATTGVPGLLEPKVGEPNDLLMEYLPQTTRVKHGDYVLTAGTLPSSGEDYSLFPPGIPVGQVTSVNMGSPYKSVNVHPLADLHNLDVVQILTAVPGSRAAQLSRVAASLPAAGQKAYPQNSTASQLASTGVGG